MLVLNSKGEESFSGNFMQCNRKTSSTEKSSYKMGSELDIVKWSFLLKELI